MFGLVTANVKWALVAIIALGIVIWGTFLLRKAETSGYNRAASECTAKALESSMEARKIEAQWQEKTREAQVEINQLRKDMASRIDAGDGAVKRLRDQLARTRNVVPTDTIAACTARASALSVVLGQCIERYSRMGSHAQGQYVDSVACLAAWPK